MSSASPNPAAISFEPDPVIRIKWKDTSRIACLSRLPTRQINRNLAITVQVTCLVAFPRVFQEDSKEDIQNLKKVGLPNISTFNSWRKA